MEFKLAFFAYTTILVSHMFSRFMFRADPSFGEIVEVFTSTRVVAYISVSRLRTCFLKF